MIRILFILIACVGCRLVAAQDPVITQFFNAPLLNNPALAAHGTHTYNLYANYRQQWIGSSSSYNTMLASVTGKILKDKVGKNNALGVGGMFMSDVSLNGGFKSTYASLNVAYLLALDPEGNSKVGLGLAGLYGNRRVDFSQLTFGQQFSSNGFNTLLPTGEAAIGAMNNYFSMSAGLLFSHQLKNAQVTLGAAGYHFNTPRQTAVKDQYEQLPTRLVVHAGIENYLDDRWALSFSTLYQHQAANDFFTGGVVLTLHPYETNRELNVATGLFYRNTKTLAPYVGFTNKSIRVGLSYDINMSSEGLFANAMKAWELGMVFGIR